MKKILLWLTLIQSITCQTVTTYAENVYEYDASVDFELSKPLPMPSGENVGKDELLEDLTPKYGESYDNIPELRQIVIDARQWNWKKAYVSLDRLVKEQPELLDGYRLQAELYLINKEYHHALAQLDEILKQNPTDVHALTLSIMTQRALMNNDDAKARLDALYKVNHVLANKVEELLDQTIEWVYTEHNQVVDREMSPKAILVFGERPQEDGALTEGLRDKLTTTLALASDYPEADIFLSGGAVHTDFTEASVMKEWLIKEGVAKERIVLDEQARDTVGNVIGMSDYIINKNLESVVIVTKGNHMGRAFTLLNLRLKQMGQQVDIDSVTSDEAVIVSLDEILYTYINALRVVDLFEKNNFT